VFGYQFHILMALSNLSNWSVGKKAELNSIFMELLLQKEQI